MREIRIYQVGPYQAGQTIALSPEAGQHVGVVLRMLPGEKITLFCGDNREFEAILVSVHKKKVSVQITSVREVSRESPRALHLAQAIAKGERMEWVMQKAAELGVASITPLITERSIVKRDEARMEKKMLQWQTIVIGACEQSGRNQIPEVKPVITLENYLQKNEEQLKFVLDPKGGHTWRDYALTQSTLALLIGPEGGFSSEELEHIYCANFKPLSLGPRILRTETAAIVGLSVLQAVCGDL